MKKVLISALLSACVVSTLSGATITGGTLFTQAGADEVESWLGRTNVAFTNIYAETSDTPEQFHAVVDLQGETVTLFQTNLGLVGGYNPVSWDANVNYYVIDLTNAGRTAFLFNLSTSIIQRQMLDTSNGEFQTYNNISRGPAFGGGSDLAAYPAESLTAGAANAFSYSNGSNLDIFGTHPSDSFTISRIETFTISEAPTSGTPEPSTWMMMAVPFGVMLLRRRAKV